MFFFSNNEIEAQIGIHWLDQDLRTLRDKDGIQAWLWTACQRYVVVISFDWNFSSGILESHTLWQNQCVYLRNTIVLPSITVPFCRSHVLLNSKLLWLWQLCYHRNLGILLIWETVTQPKSLKYQLGPPSGLDRSKKASTQFVHLSVKANLHPLTYPLLVPNDSHYQEFCFCFSPKR